MKCMIMMPFLEAYPERSSLPQGPTNAVILYRDVSLASASHPSDSEPEEQPLLPLITTTPQWSQPSTWDIAEGTKPPRPRNKWILFREDFCARNEGRFTNVAGMASAIWQSLGPQEQRPWALLAELENDMHDLVWPKYKYKPNDESYVPRKRVRKPRGKKAIAAKRLEASLAVPKASDVRFRLGETTQRDELVIHQTPDSTQHSSSYDQSHQWADNGVAGSSTLQYTPDPHSIATSPIQPTCVQLPESMRAQLHQEPLILVTQLYNSPNFRVVSPYDAPALQKLSYTPEYTDAPDAQCFPDDYSGYDPQAYDLDIGTVPVSHQAPHGALWTNPEPLIQTCLPVFNPEGLEELNDQLAGLSTPVQYEAETFSKPTGFGVTFHGGAPNASEIMSFMYMA